MLAVEPPGKELFLRTGRGKFSAERGLRKWAYVQRKEMSTHGVKGVQGTTRGKTERAAPLKIL